MPPTDRKGTLSPAGRCGSSFMLAKIMPAGGITNKFVNARVQETVRIIAKGR
jgi:hypothetical protein